VNVTDYLRIFRHYWWMLAVFTAVGLVLGYLSWVVNFWIIDFGPKYQSTATLFVATQTGTTTAEAYQNDMFSQQRAVSYAALATSEQVAARAVDQLKSSISPDDLRAKISAKVRDKTVMLDVSVTDSSPEVAQAYADAVSNQLVAVVSQLETSRRGGTPSAAAVIVDNADYPTKPAGFKLWMRLLLGAAGGLVVGILVAIVTGTLDKRLRGRENVESETGSLVMGALPKDPLRRNVAVVDLSGNGLYVERIRELRTNLRFTVPPDGSGPARCIAVTSPSAGDGRTTTAIDLSAAIAESGRSVILVDGDLRSPAIADRLLQGATRARAMHTGLSTVLTGEDEIGSAVISHVDVGDHTITLLPAGPLPPRPGELWATDRATKLLEYLGGAFDYVVVDTPPLNDYTDGAIVGALGHGAIVLARIAGTTDRALRRAVQVLQAAHVAILGTVVTFEPVSRGVVRAHAKQRGHNVVQPHESGTPVESK
jgi:capsular exopolysaccharide synthesis family protein